MKRHIAITMFFFAANIAQAQRSDQELNRDSVTGWQYVSNPPKPNAVYKPIKSQFGGGAAYTAWQQQASDKLISWLQQSYLPRGLVMRTIAKNDDRWYVYDNGPLHSYGVNFLGYDTHFANGKIDLRCCEQGQRLVAGFNDFPGGYITGFNPGGLYFFAEQAQFTSGDDEAQLAKEGIDKKIQPNLYSSRTYLDHYHDNGQQVFKIGVVVAKNNEWPFKPVLVKDAVAYIQQQMEAYPAIMQKNPYSADVVQKALERLKPYYNEAAKLKAGNNYNNSINDGNGHYLLNPSDIINGKSIDKTFPEYSILVSTTRQTIDQTKTDNPLWVYFNLTPTNVALQGNLAKFDAKFGTAVPHMVHSLLSNFNFDFMAKWLAQPDERKAMAYAPLKAPAKSAGNVFITPVSSSATAAAKNKDASTILYEDFQGYPEGTFSSKAWHTYGHDGHSTENATLAAVNGQDGKWVSIPDAYTFYPDLLKLLPTAFTVSYDVYFGSNISNKRSSLYFRLDIKDPEKSNPIDIRDVNRDGFQFAIAASGEAEVNKRYMSASIDEKVTNVKIPVFKSNDAAHIRIAVNGTAVSVFVNGKEIMHDGNALPAGKSFKRVGWYCGIAGMYLGNIEIRKEDVKN